MKEKPSLLIIGNSNVGKSSITKLLLPHPSKFKGKVGKKPGSTLLIRSFTQPGLEYQIVDLPGFGYMKSSSKRREEHVKKQIIIHVEKHHAKYFLALIVINVLRIEDELVKYHLLRKDTIPLSFELINFISEFYIPRLILFNKIDKLSKRDTERILNFFIEQAREHGIQLIHLNDYDFEKKDAIPYLEFSALKRVNVGKLKWMIEECWKRRKI
ncbi:MAG: GTPase [Promethearchaeota archaeon]